jgi:LytS/YehU family sensor histidine kinase
VQNPHFLFNTLTSIEALSGSHPDRIPSLIQRLATYLRVQLRPSPTMFTTFGNELDGVKAYLEIEQLRFGDGLETDYDVDPAALGCLVPELILQPLVENAIKHGFRADSNIRLDITARVDRGKLRVDVTNPGKLNYGKTDKEGSSSSGFGIGIANMKQRLRAHFSDQASFRIRQRDGRVVAELVIPERRGAN